MRRTSCLLVVLLVSCASGFGQAPTKQNRTFPRIVAQFERFGQTAPINSFTIYTPKHAGLFRCSVVILTTKANGENGAGWSAGLLTANAAQVLDFSAEVTLDQGLSTGYTENPFREKAEAPMTFSVSGFGNTQGSKYNVFVVVEQLM